MKSQTGRILPGILMCRHLRYVLSAEDWLVVRGVQRTCHQIQILSALAEILESYLLRQDRIRGIGKSRSVKSELLPLAIQIQTEVPPVDYDAISRHTLTPNTRPQWRQANDLRYVNRTRTRRPLQAVR